MIRVLRFALITLALVAASTSWPRAQGGAEQKPPAPKPAATAAGDAQKPAAPAQELPAEAVAFNAAAGEKNPLKRVEALEKFVADNPKASPMLLSMARSQITSSALAAFKDSRAKYLAIAEKDIADAAKRTDVMPAYATYNRLASALLGAGIHSEEAEDFARKGLAAMDEPTYMDMRKKQYERSLATYEKMTAAAGRGEAEAGCRRGSPGALSPPAPNYRFAMKDGVMQASLAPPAPPRPATPPRPPTRPSLPTDDELRASLKSERASALATLGQILMKRGKTEEGEKALTEAYAAKPAASTMAAIARVLAESAKKSGNEASHSSSTSPCSRCRAESPRTKRRSSRPPTARPTTARSTGWTRCWTSAIARITCGSASRPSNASRRRRRPGRRCSPRSSPARVDRRAWGRVSPSMPRRNGTLGRTSSR